MNYKITDFDPKFFLPIFERPIYFEGKNHKQYQIGATKALVRYDEGNGPQCISIVGEDYKVVHNTQVFEAIEPILADLAYDIDLDIYEDAFGRRTYFDMQFNNIECNVTGRDKTRFRAIVYNGYGQSSLGCMFGAINFFCLNGMILGEVEFKRKRHTKGLTPKVIEAWIKEGINNFHITTKTFQRWSAVPILQKHILPLFEEYDKPNAEEMVGLLVSKYGATHVTLWDIYNAMTDVATHKESSAQNVNYNRFTKLRKAYKFCYNWLQEHNG